VQDGGSLGTRLAELRIAIAGDLHGQWDSFDEQLLELLSPDALLVVGDLKRWSAPDSRPARAAFLAAGLRAR